MAKMFKDLGKKTCEIGGELKLKTFELGATVKTKTSEFGDYLEKVCESEEPSIEWLKVDELAPTLEEGDIVEFDRGGSLYRHLAVYIGNGEVIHLAGGMSDFVRIGDSINLKSRQFDVANVEVKKEELAKVAGSSPCRKNNSKDDVLQPSDAEFIVARAHSRIGKRRGYSPLYDNDKHFALWCRYGMNFSTNKSEENPNLHAWGKIDELLKYIKVGDLIDFRRAVAGKRILEHWGVYIGMDTLADGKSHHTIVHRTGTAGTFLSAKFNRSTQICVVEKADLVAVAGSDNCRVNNALDKFQTAFEPKEVVERAVSMLGKSDYDALKMNCEHFANWCRYGAAFSMQAEKVLEIGVR